MAIILTVISLVVIFTAMYFIYKKKHNIHSYDGRKKDNLQKLKGDLQEQDYSDEDIENRVAYADENYKSDNAGNIDEGLYELVMSKSFYDKEENHYSNQENS